MLSLLGAGDFSTVLRLAKPLAVIVSFLIALNISQPLARHLKSPVTRHRIYKDSTV